MLTMRTITMGEDGQQPSAFESIARVTPTGWAVGECPLLAFYQAAEQEHKAHRQAANSMGSAPTALFLTEDTRSPATGKHRSCVDKPTRPSWPMLHVILGERPCEHEPVP